MQPRDWIVTDDGHCQPCPTPRQWDLLRPHYYLHQFLTDILDILAPATSITAETALLPAIRRQVRQLISNSYWVQTQCPRPGGKTGVGIQILYDEIGYPLTVENVSFAPQQASDIHNHGTWGVVAVLSGQEHQTFWRRSPTAAHPHRIQPVGEKQLTPGDIISFTPGAIHSIRAVSSTPTVTFNLYGETELRSRFSFDPVHHTAKPF